MKQRISSVNSEREEEMPALFRLLENVNNHLCLGYAECRNNNLQPTFRIYSDCSATSAGSSFISGTVAPTCSCLPSTMHILSFLYAWSTSSLTTTASYAPVLRAYSISAVEASNRDFREAADSVPRPVRRDRSADREGGERKMKSGLREG